MSGKITGSITLDENDPVIQPILSLNQKVLAALQPLPNCVVHLELFRRTNGELVFLEIACRAPGGMIVQMHHKHCHINFEQAHFSMQMGLPFDLTQHNQGPYCAWAWFPLVEGTIRGFQSLPIQSHHQIVWKIKVGETYSAAKSLIDYGGSIILWNEDYAELRRDFNYLAALIESPILTHIEETT